MGIFYILSENNESKLKIFPYRPVLQKAQAFLLQILIEPLFRRQKNVSHSEKLLYILKITEKTEIFMRFQIKMGGFA